jgi:hypothetical protein
MDITSINARIAFKTALDTKKAVFKKVRNPKLVSEKGCNWLQLILNRGFGPKEYAFRKDRTNGVIK